MTVRRQPGARGSVALAFATTAFGLFGCYASHERAAVGARIDGGAPVDAGGRDAHPRPRPPVTLLPGETCDGLYTGHRPAPCDADFERRCQRTMELAANGWYGHTRCEDHLPSTECGNGDFCPPDEPCRCAASVTCPHGYVCVSDTPDGPRWCRLQCAP